MPKENCKINYGLKELGNKRDIVIEYGLQEFTSEIKRKRGERDRSVMEKKESKIDL